MVRWNLIFVSLNSFTVVSMADYNFPDPQGHLMALSQNQADSSLETSKSLCYFEVSSEPRTRDF